MEVNNDILSTVKFPPPSIAKKIILGLCHLLEVELLWVSTEASFLSTVHGPFIASNKFLTNIICDVNT